MAHAEMAGLLTVQGRLQVDSTLVDGTVAFKFALVNGDGSQTYWRNAPDDDLDGQPDQAVVLRLDRGLYTLALGDAGLANMASLPATVFTNSALYLRTWLDDGTHGFQALTPDQRITPVGYALLAATVSDGGITLAKLAPGVLDAANLTGVLAPAQLPVNVAFRDTDLLTLSNAWVARLAATNEALTARIEALAVLSEALAGQLTALSNQMRLPPFGLAAVSAARPDTTLASYGFVPFGTVPAPSWVDGPTTDAPLPRRGHSGVWTGAALVIWGGTLGLGLGLYSAAGGSYDRLENRWRALSPLNAPVARTAHTAVWTGQEMLVWGGFGSAGYLSSGARWEPSQQTWTALPMLNAPEGREGHVAVWTGTRLLVWGGRNSGGLLADGAQYDPVLSQWSPLLLRGAPAARFGTGGVWAGDRFIVWGGEGEAGPVDSGGQLLLDSNGVPTEWRALNPTGAPAARSGHAAVWTGQKMIVWGGATGRHLIGGWRLVRPQHRFLGGDEHGWGAGSAL
ncbi:MAG: hypothetical protein FJ387_23995 [Verrucomicrobia bacterium]|nr:hypothetical protein [Verrucomicrobiota bacterium]